MKRVTMVAAIVLTAAACKHEHTVAPSECVGVTKPVGAQHGWHEDSLFLRCK